MKIALIGKKYILKENLPKNLNNNYWVIDRRNNTKIFKVKNNFGKLEIESDSNFQIINPKYLEIKDDNIYISNTQNWLIKKIELEENNIYAICFGDINDIYILFCLPDYEGDFYHMDIANVAEFTIGYDKKNDIVYENALVADTHAKIYKQDEKWYIENYDKNYGLFVNEFPVYENKKHIFNGDVIFIMGLKIIIMKNSIYITNPNKNVRINKKIFMQTIVRNEIDGLEEIYSTEEIEIKEDKKKRYYSRSPRLDSLIKTEKIKIDEPPQLQENEQRPMILAIASSLLMGVMSLSYIGSMIQSVSNGSISVGGVIFSLLEIIAMLSMMVIIPIIEIKWDKKSREGYEKKRQKKYKEYLSKKKEQIEQIKNKQKEILYKRDVSANDCVQIIMSENHRLWERTVEDEDFLTVRIGTGSVPLNIDITRPEERFAMVEDSLVEEYNNLLANAKMIEEAPVVTSFVRNNISAVISKDYEIIRKLMRNIILQLITFHSFDDLKLVFFLNESQSKEWEFVKLLPHVWDDARQTRFFADNYADINELSNYLQDELKNRSSEKDYKSHTPYYLIITDDFKQIESIPFITEFMEQTNNLGFSLLCISDDLYNVPNKCTAFFNISDTNTGTLMYNEVYSKEEYEVKMDEIKPIIFEKISQKLSNIPVRVNTQGAASLPSSLSFLQMYNVGRIEQLDILKRWHQNDSTLSLKAPIGMDSNGNIISLDIHEKYHGPHGLIAGSTGSGKSEFIITYILSLAINYHPDDVAFLLIDYKGGGLAGAFKKNDIQLPHLVGTITNIDTNGLQRSLTSIQSELRRRQVIFNEARNMTDGGTIDIYKYQRLYHNGMVKEPIPHLFIICDEFAELKQQQEDFMEELMSVSRIGRSLGVHLILATQKPAGIVNDQIRSNSKFAVCLKVQDTIDSSDVIMKPDAAYLKKAGQFYLRVGQDEYYTLGQSGWAGAPYIPSDTTKKKVDSSIEFINNIGETIKRLDDTKQQKNKDEGEQLTNIVEYLCELAREKGINKKSLWLENISEDIYVKDLREKYEIQPDSLEAVVGEYDDPYNQRQGIVKIDLLKKDNVIVFGNAKSGKETFLSTFVYDLITEYTSEQVQMYFMDFGSEALKIYKNAPHVGDMIFMGEDEKLFRFFEMLQNEIKTRKDILSNYNGDYNTYIAKGNKMPFIVIIINNYEAFDENYEEQYDDLFLALTREALKCGMMFVVTANSTASMKYRLGQNFNKKIALQLNDDDEYYSIFDNIQKKRPAHIFGRGLIKGEGDSIFEFQTAKICEHISYNEHIEEIIEKIKQENKVKAKALPALPKVLMLEQVEEHITDMTSVPIGMIKDDLSILLYDFMERFITIIASRSVDVSVNYAFNICEEAKQMQNTNIIILNANIKDDMKKQYKSFVTTIKKGIKSKEEAITLCVIVGITDLIDDGIIDDFDFNELLENAKQSGKYCFIIVDKPNKIEEHGFDSWYENNISSGNGIWIGKGIENQTLISTNFNADGLINDCDNSFGYYVENGDTVFIKLLGMKEEGDTDE